MEPIDIDICNTQARIYKYICQEKYNVEQFSDAYLQSDFCNREMDAKYSHFQLESELECLDFIMPEIKKYVSKTNTQTFDEDVAFWIGYMYRYLQLYTKTDSKSLQQKLSFKKMCEYYPGMHTIDDQSAAQIILENL